MTQADLLPEPLPEGDKGASSRGREALRDGRFGEAAEWYERAVGGDPGADTEDLLGLAEARLWQGRYGDVERVCRDLLAREPGHREARALIGIALAHLDDPAGAVGFLLSAPDHPAVHIGLALANERLGLFREAEAAARRALALAPEFPGAFRALGSILSNQRRRGEALAAFGKALKLDPDDAPARLALAEARLALGHFDAWPEVDWRLKVPGFSPAYPPAGPAWDGAPAAGKTLLLIAEPAPGDEFLFVRFAATLKGAGARVVLACRPEMAAILSRAEGVDRVLSDPTALDEPVDAHAYLMSLPGLLRLTSAGIPVEPYLSPDPALASRWAAEVAALPGDYKVAIHWGGGPSDRRALPLDLFARLAAVPGVHLISVQKNSGDSAAGAGFPLTDYGPKLDAGPSAFADAAAVLTAVDLFVTNDCDLAHLAGALGVPTWVALPVGPDWRWMADRSDSPWYPGVRLFRQARQGDWSGVFSAMEPMLRAGVACRSSSLRAN